MSYVPTYEREARAEGEAKGLRDAISLALKSKFAAAGERLLPRVFEINDVSVLRGVMESVMRSNSADEVRLDWGQ